MFGMAWDICTLLISPCWVWGSTPTEHGLSYPFSESAALRCAIDILFLQSSVKQQAPPMAPVKNVVNNHDMHIQICTYLCDSIHSCILLMRTSGSPSWMEGCNTTSSSLISRSGASWRHRALCFYWFWDSPRPVAIITAARVDS